ncbi:hypothetical protein [Sorangium atrum]|uniref:Uncharacterized protein n=1 Tax=Sorangium atrum TaxID=2995308 RepID=A0ABT5C898_9BACT|nr:hypothetical protein [Sorangium aterium]MDC0681863.1 hypothetical protein [Sorangium aterium]
MRESEAAPVVQHCGHGWLVSARRRSPGYRQLGGGAFALLIVEIDAAAEAEDDDLLPSFGHSEARTVEARR